MLSRQTVLMTLLALVMAAAAGVRATAADEGLILHLTFDALSADGTTTPDASGQGRHARLHGHSLVDGVVGKAIRFDGYPEQVVALGDLKLKAPATVVLWLKTRDLVNDRRLLSQAAGPESQAGALRLLGQVDIATGKRWAPLVTRKLRHDTWTHLAVVVDAAGNATGYLNGEAQETVPAGFDFDGQPATLGGKFLGRHGAVFTGLIDDLRIYARALPAEEIDRLYRMQAPN